MLTHISRLVLTFTPLILISQSSYGSPAATCRRRRSATAGHSPPPTPSQRRSPWTILSWSTPSQRPPPHRIAARGDHLLKWHTPSAPRPPRHHHIAASPRN